MTPKQKILATILRQIIDGYWDTDESLQERVAKDVAITDENVDDLWDELEEYCYDELNEFRCSGIETNLPSQYSRHYESEFVACRVFDGTWVGWTYWYGGGKHGCPEEIDWLSDAEEIDCIEEEKLVVVQTFSKITK